MLQTNCYKCTIKSSSCYFLLFVIFYTEKERERETNEEERKEREIEY